MARSIVIPISPEHVRNILSGTKKYEYRTKAAKHDVSKIIIYETLPAKRVVAEAEILEAIALEPEALWEKTKDHSGIAKEFFDACFKEWKIAYAYSLGKIKVYDTPKPLCEFTLKAAPQSCAYVPC